MTIGVRNEWWVRWRLPIVLVLLVVTLGVLGTLAFGVVRSTRGDSGPSIGELEDRLRRIGTDPTLTRTAPDAALVGSEPVLCADSSSPHYSWRYAYGGPFESVVTFYDDIFRADHWAATGAIYNGGVTYAKKFSGWTAEGLVQPIPGGYSVVVTVDKDYESGCPD